MTASRTVAVLGLGQMGTPIAVSLLRAGFELRIWNRSPRQVPELAGAAAAATPRAAVAGADVALTMLADDRAVEQVVLGADGVLEGLSPGALHLGMSTISVALSRQLAQWHAEKRQAFVAAPVFGRPEAAAARLLWIVAGGPADAIARATPLFIAMGQGHFTCDSAPQASLAKLVGNFLIAATIESLGEALVLAEKGGIDPEWMQELLAGTIFGSPVVKNYGARIARTEFVPPGFALALGLKDVRLALAAAQEVGAPLPLGELARERLEGALALGRDGFDFAGFASVIREAAGLPPRRPGARSST